MVKIAKNANPFTVVAAAQTYFDDYYQAPKSHKPHAPSSRQTQSSRSNASNITKNKEIAKPITPPSESVFDEDRMKETKTGKDYAYHKEKMMLCKQEEKGVPLSAEEGDWLNDTNEESDE
ncbi:hypothetical protein Tco_1039008 [Tanacetum coccineum]